jgi:hypothetical protein
MIPKGKSHGLVLLLDKSGSMSRNMAGSIEQILVLTMFCRKVNIPFIVYGFGGQSSVRAIDIGRQNFSNNDRSFECGQNDLNLCNVYLREYLNSKMSNAEFTKAMKHMLLIKESFTGLDNYFRRGRCPRFETEELSNTPMTEALIATAEIMKDFKQKNNLDITNLVIVHDGDADNIGTYCSEREDYHGKMFMGTKYFEKKDSNYYLQDSKHKYQKAIDLSNLDCVNQVVLDWFKQVTGCKVFGFFLCEGYRGAAKYAIENRLYVNDEPLGNLRYKDWMFYKETLAKKQKELRSEKFLESKSPGFESFFLIAGGKDLETEDEGIEVEGKMTTKKLASAFAKYNKKKSVNRVLVSKFIQGIAA